MKKNGTVRQYALTGKMSAALAKDPAEYIREWWKKTATPDEWERRLIAQCPDILPRWLKHNSVIAAKFLNLGFATARAMREALALGYERVLFLEDDIRFLKDLDKVETILSATPKGRHIVQYDKFCPWEMTTETYRAICAEGRLNEFFFDPQRKTFYSGACFMADRIGIEKMLAYSRNVCPIPVDGIFAKLEDARCAVAVENVAIQVFYGDAMAGCYCAGQGNTHHKAYAPMKLDYSLYQVPDEYGHDAKDVIG